MGSGITLKETAAVDITTPTTGKHTIFVDQATGIFSEKDDAGSVQSLADAAGGYGPGGPDVPVADGGTGASTASAARTNLGVDTAIAAAIAALVASAPGALDTLDELAAAFGDDANFASTMTTALAGKQPLDSDLTAIAALTTTSFGRSLLEATNAAALRTLAGAVIGTDVQAFDADIPTVSASQAEMEAGSETALRSMSPLRVAQAIAALAAGGGAGDLDAVLATSSGQDIAEALLGAAAPAGANVFATMADLGTPGPASPLAKIYVATIAR